MTVFKRLLQCIGEHAGTYKLWLDPTAPAAECATQLTVSSELDGRLARIDYRWEADGKPAQGLLLINVNEKTGAATATWIDTWHQPQLMHNTGQQDDTAIRVTGSYGDGQGGPDWGWRTEIEADADGNSVTLRAINITPDGEEAPAVEAVCRRK